MQGLQRCKAILETGARISCIPDRSRYFAPVAETQPQERKKIILKTYGFLSRSSCFSATMAVPTMPNPDNAQMKQHHLKTAISPPFRVKPLQHLDPGLALSNGAAPGTTHLLTWVFKCFTSSQHWHSSWSAGPSLQKTSSQVTFCMDLHKASLQITWEKSGKQTGNKNGN